MAKILTIMASAPYEKEYSFAGLFVMVVAPLADIEGSIVFVEDGVHNAVKNQNPTGYFKIGEDVMGYPSIEPLLRDTMDFGISVYVPKEDIEERGVKPEDLIEGVEVISREQIPKLFIEHDFHFVF